MQHYFETIAFQAEQMLPNFWEHSLSVAQWALREIAAAYVLTPALAEALKAVDTVLQEIASDPDSKLALMGDLRAKLADLEQALSACSYDEAWAFVHGA